MPWMAWQALAGRPAALVAARRLPCRRRRCRPSGLPLRFNPCASQPPSCSSSSSIGSIGSSSWGAASISGTSTVPPDGIGTITTYDPFPSTIAIPRRIDIWTPPGYKSPEAAQQRYPVLYCHDGQNCLLPGPSFKGNDWGLRQAVVGLAADGAIPTPPILVCLWNTPDRIREYMPADVLRWLQARFECWHDLVPEAYYNPTSDAYVDFLANEVKPWVDRNFRSLPGREHTAVMGSSMGGLVSLYVLQRHPEVFGAAACLSTHWPAAGGATLGWLGDHAPDPASSRLYMDHGTKGLDSDYPPYQRTADELLIRAGFKQWEGFESHVFEGAGHDEEAWRRRVHIPLTFLFGGAAGGGGVGAAVATARAAVAASGKAGNSSGGSSSALVTE